MLLLFIAKAARYDYIVKGTFLSRKEDFHTKERFYFKILNPFTKFVHVLTFKWLKEIGNGFCMTFTSLLIDLIKPQGSDGHSFCSRKFSFRPVQLVSNFI